MRARGVWACKAQLSLDISIDDSDTVETGGSGFGDSLGEHGLVHLSRHALRPCDSMSHYLAGFEQAIPSTSKARVFLWHSFASPRSLEDPLSAASLIGNSETDHIYAPTTVCSTQSSQRRPLCFMLAKRSMNSTGLNLRHLHLK